MGAGRGRAGTQRAPSRGAGTTVPRAGRVPPGSGSTVSERPRGERRRVLAAPGWPQETHSPWRWLIRLHVLSRLRSTSSEETLIALERASSAERHVSDSPAASSAARRGRGWATGRFRFLPRAPASPPAPRPQLPACSRSREAVGKTTVGARRNWVCAAAQTRPEMRAKSGRVACVRFIVVMALQSRLFGLVGRWPSVPVITRRDPVGLGCCAIRGTKQPCVESCPACLLSWVLWAASEEA